jgi:hypothetical protein
MHHHSVKCSEPGAHSAKKRRIDQSGPAFGWCCLSGSAQQARPDRRRRKTMSGLLSEQEILNRDELRFMST